MGTVWDSSNSLNCFRNIRNMDMTFNVGLENNSSFGMILNVNYVNTKIV